MSGINGYNLGGQLSLRGSALVGAEAEDNQIYAQAQQASRPREMHASGINNASFGDSQATTIVGDQNVTSSGGRRSSISLDSDVASTFVPSANLRMGGGEP